MATYSVRKNASGVAADNQIGGLVTSRYEKASMAFGTIPAGSYNCGDTISFDDVDSKYIVEAHVTAHLGGSVVTLDVVPGTNLTTGPLALNIGTGATGAGTGGTGTYSNSNPGPLLSYVIYYIRGNGAVQASANVGGSAGDLLQVTVSASTIVAKDTVTSTETGPTV
jgi:hypothetical protein